MEGRQDMPNRRSLSRRRVLALSAGLAGGAAFGAGLTADAYATGTTIRVSTRQPVGTVAKGLFGHNQRYDYAGQGAWEVAGDRPHPEMVDAITQSGSTNIRFPGGTIGNTYHWQRAIGPVADRVDNASGGGDGASVSNEYGPDEFGALLDATGTVGTIMANFATGTAQEAADWVAYMNSTTGPWAELRARNGHPEPYGIRYWEVGNELGFGNQAYWLGAAPEEQRVGLYVNGGTVTLSDAPVVRESDRRAEAAVSDGSPDQVFYAAYPPVVPGSQAVSVDGATWTEVDAFDGGGKSVYRFEPSAGKIVFGDGESGRIPPAGATITISCESGPHDGFVDFYRAMKTVDSTVTVCTGWNPFRSGGQASLISALGDDHPYDAIADHLYSNRPDATTPEQYHDELMLMPAQRAAGAAELRRLARKTSKRRVDVVVTEWNIFKYEDIVPNYQLALGGALFSASQLNEFTRIGLPLAQKHSLSGWIYADGPDGGRHFGSTWGLPGYVATGPAKTIELYALLAGTTLVKSEVTNNPSRTVATGQMSALDVVATRASDGTCRIVVVNRDRERTITTDLSVEGIPDTRVDADVAVLTGPNVLAHNTPEDRDVVSISTRSATINPHRFSHTFQPLSITMITIA